MISCILTSALSSAKAVQGAN